MKNTPDASFAELTGRSAGHLVPCWSGHLVHPAVLVPLEQLREDAGRAGFELAVASSYRDYERQLSIWREKVAGLRPVLDAQERPLDPAQTSPEQLLWALLRWSALPGTSRHHWGTDLDVFDAKSLREQGCRLQLTVAECTGTGPLSDFHQWLDERIAAGQARDFYRPYGVDRGGVAMEPWHLSYAPVACALQAAMSFELFEQLLAERAWPLQVQIEARAREIYERFVQLP